MEYFPHYFEQIKVLVAHHNIWPIILQTNFVFCTIDLTSVGQKDIPISVAKKKKKKKPNF